MASSEIENEKCVVQNVRSRVRYAHNGVFCLLERWICEVIKLSQIEAIAPVGSGKVMRASYLQYFCNESMGIYIKIEVIYIAYTSECV